MTQLSWHYLAYNELSLAQLYDLLSLRQMVFVVEQQCVFLDTDRKDQASWHLLGYADDGSLAAYCRIVPPDVIYDREASIGRVVTAPNYRHLRLGHELMQRALDLLQKQFPNTAVRIGAQYYLLRFYESWGFCATGEPYLEDDIWHTQMLLSPPIEQHKNNGSQ